MSDRSPVDSTVPAVSDPDEEARRRVREALDRTLFLEASAGTGKTHALVERVLALLASGVPLGQLAVVTFLRAAGDELRVRLSDALSREAADWARQAESALPEAAMGTLHAFAHRLLTEYALEAGLNPGAGVLEETAERQLRLKTVARFLERRLADPPAAWLDLRRLGVSLSVKDLADLAKAIPPEPALPPVPDPVADAAGDRFLEDLARARSAIAELSQYCRDPLDRALEALPMIDSAIAEVRSWQGRARVLAACRVQMPGVKIGNKTNWKPETALAELRDVVSSVVSGQRALLDRVGQEVAHGLLTWLAPFPAAYAAAREAAGVMSYDDMLRRCVTFLERSPDVRAWVRRRYTTILVDEFQDTDPVQVRLIDLITAGEEGRLFAVGDPKQSIYRFRGADLTTYLSVVGRAAADARPRIQRSSRPVPALATVVNAMCGPLFRASQDGIEYTPLVSRRMEGPANGEPPLQVLRVQKGSSAAEDRQREAEAVAGWLYRLLEEGRVVTGVDGTLRRPRPEDVAILFARRTAMEAYAGALASVGIRTQASGGRGALNHPVGQDVLRLLAAVARPTSPLQVASAVRCGLTGVSDVDLLQFRKAGREFNLLTWSGQPHDGVPQAVARVMDALADAALSLGAEPAARLAGLLRSLDLPAAAALRGGEVGLRALERVVETVWAHACADRSLGLAEIVDLMEDGEEAEPAGQPEAKMGPAAVRMFTIHQAKGLEFPVVVLADVGSGPPGRKRLGVWKTGGSKHVELTLAFDHADVLGTLPAREALQDDAIKAAAESRRLLYVALTRARDVLCLPDSRRHARGSFVALLHEAAGVDGKSAPALDQVLERLGLSPVAVELTTGPAVEPATFNPVDALSRDGEGGKGLVAVARPVVTADLDARGSSLVDEIEASMALEAYRDARRALHERLHEALKRPSGGMDSHAKRHDGSLDLEALFRHPLIQKAVASPLARVGVVACGRLPTGQSVRGEVDLIFGRTSSWQAVFVAFSPPSRGVEQDARELAKVLALAYPAKCTAAHLIWAVQGKAIRL